MVAEYRKSLPLVRSSNWILKGIYLLCFLVFIAMFYVTYSPMLGILKIYKDNQPRSHYNNFNPPRLDSHSWFSNPQMSLKILSQVVQDQITELQDSRNCVKNNIFCGHFDDCGFGCQIHHRAACLMMSYAMGLPLIHDMEVEGFEWAYSTPWTDFFLPIGSSCSVGSHTHNWTWHHYHEFYERPSNNSDFMWKLNGPNEADEIGYPLFNGIVVSSPLADLVQKLYPDPPMWWISQFIQHTMQIQSHVMKKIQQEQNSIGIRSDCIGFHVRRTDKVNEYSESYHELHEYFSLAQDFIGDGKKKHQVFLASDDSSLLSAAKINFTDWEIVGYLSNQTFRSPDERKDSLYEILREVVTLAQCPTVICGLTSNLCRLILELQMTRQDGVKPNLIPIDGSYYYPLWGTSLKLKINKIDSGI